MILLETLTKYYHISIMWDIFHDLLVVCDYSSNKTRFSYSENIHVASMAETNRTIDKIIQIRATHAKKRRNFQLIIRR